MKKQILLSLILAGSMVTAAHAEEQANQQANTSTVKVTDVQNKEEAAKDIDNEITNAKMRAESGSKSKWSMSADLTYNGGNLVDPLGKVRPNYSGEASQQGVTQMFGDIGVSYRIDPKNRLSLSTGISVVHPLHSSADEISKMSSDGGATDVSTPSISYGHTARIGTTQNSFSASYSHATADYDVNVTKSIGAVGFGHTMIFDIANSNWQPGISTSIGYSVFSDDATATDVIGNKRRRSDYSFGVYPFAEYAFNDTFSFRTVFRPFSYSHMRSDEAGTFEKSMYTQSMGLGIAITRDIYLYPNMQFAPENLKPELTNVGLNTTLNVF
ncbi:hypothetical protein [Bdellovibrio reynosensis]|uniref:DUF3570 domain-containing protein n=1 Tax=Bdellovibrio reynosensis TaxID=2835041 RepID=A0ABY4CAP7_9BACT|nr:hypothetical protein [Bdellovibrio reynosensis]UOF02007.1 hypothetical protein MNR06_03445 [Bdellovibrio reynosensis]